MKRSSSPLLAMLTAWLALLLTLTPALAADSIGGDLSATPTEAWLTSNATRRVAVQMSATHVTVEPASFQLDPGETKHMTLSGPAVGSVTALLSQLGASGTGDNASVTLVVRLEPPAPEPPIIPILLTALAVTASVLVLRRVRPWEWRITRRPT